MSERRKRRSLWDKEAETNHFSGTSENNYWTGKEHHSSHDSEQYHEFSASGSHRAPKFRDHFGQPSLESLEEDPVASMNGSYIRSRENAPEGKELGGENRYYQRMSPGLKNNHSLGNDRSHSHRYPGRGRSRSRSRSRTRGRSRSRSLSRGRERERERERVRGRSRSRSRSRDDDSARGQRSWINRTDHGHISRHSYSSRGPRSELRDDVSDPYYGEDDQFQSKSRNAVPCKDFMKGNCRWGDSCRFSHHFASDGTFSKGTKYSSFDKDAEQQPPYKSGKPLCKYFAAGKCDRSNCRFSHEDSKYNGLEVREGKVTDDDSLNRRGSKRNGSTRNDATRITDNMKHSGWNESFVTLTNNIDDNTNAKNDIRFSHDLGNENINWGIPERRESLIDRDNLPSPPAGSGTYGRDLGTAEYIGRKNMAKDQELLMMHGSKLHNLAGDLNVKGQNKLQVDERFSMKPWQNVPQVPNIQQHGHGVVENNPVNSFTPDVHDEVKDSRIGAEPIPPSGQNLTQIGENVFPGLSSNPNKSDIGQSMPCPNPSDLFRSDLSGPGTHLIANLDLQSLMQNHQKAIQMTGMLKTKVQEFFPNSETSEHSAQFTNPLISITDQQIAPVKNPIMFTSQGFENEHSRKDVDIQVPHPVGMVPSFPDAGLHVPLVETTNLQPNSVRGSHDPVYPMDNDRGTNEHGNNAEQDNQMQVGRSSALSIAGVEPDNSKADHSGRPELKQDTVLANSEEDEGKRVIDEESEGVKNNKHSETDGHGKTEESNANKDDKGMRLFKNSLIEFVKDILKPTWKEGRMSREVHKTIVKKVVDKVTSTIQVDHIPKTQEKVEQYLSYSKPKIAKLIQAYVGRSLKTDS